VLERASPDRPYQVLVKTRLARAFRDIGQLRWRALMLAVVLIALFVPLRQSLYHLRDETVARRAVREVISSLASLDTIVAEQLELSADRIVLRTVVTEAAYPAATSVQRFECDPCRAHRPCGRTSQRGLAGGVGAPAQLRDRLHSGGSPHAGALQVGSAP